MSKYSENIPPSIIGAIGWFYDDIPQNAVVLDVGCSTGYYGSYIKEHKKAKVYGVELSDDKHEAKKVLDDVYSFDLDGDWPKEVAARKYDVIFLGDVIEHLKDPGKTLEKLRSMVSPTGRVYISTPNIAHISIRLELLGGSFEYESMGILDSTHLKYFTLNSLTNVVTQAGYDVVRIDSSESDYPREVAESILQKYGLTPSEKFWKLVSDPTARAFQYKFVLKASKKGKTKPVPSPVQKPEQYKAEFIADIKAETTKEKQKYEALSKEFDKLRKENEKIGKTLLDVTHSKTYKLALKLQNAKTKTLKVVGK